MADTCTDTGATAAIPRHFQHIPGKSADVIKLHNTIELLDSLSQEGFSQIAAIAGLALAAMQTQAGNDLEAIAYALQAIKSKARDIENCINAEAEQVGCNYKDVGVQRWSSSGWGASRMTSR